MEAADLITAIRYAANILVGIEISITAFVMFRRSSEMAI